MWRSGAAFASSPFCPFYRTKCCSRSRAPLVCRGRELAEGKRVALLIERVSFNTSRQVLAFFTAYEMGVNDITVASARAAAPDVRELVRRSVENNAKNWSAA